MARKLLKIQGKDGQPWKPFGVVMSEFRRTVKVLGEPVRKVGAEAATAVKKVGVEARTAISKVDLLDEAKQALGAEVASPVEQAVDTEERAEAAEQSHAVLPDADLDTLSAGIEGMDDTELAVLEGMLDDHLDATGAAEQPFRDVGGNGGWKYRQHADGTITILVDGRAARGEITPPGWQGRVLADGAAFDAITTEIGDYPSADAGILAKIKFKDPSAARPSAARPPGRKVKLPKVPRALRVKKGAVRVTPPKLQVRGRTVKLRSPVVTVASEGVGTLGGGDMGMNFSDPWEAGLAQRMHPSTYGASYNPAVKGEAIPYMIGALNELANMGVLEAAVDALDPEDADMIEALVNERDIEDIEVGRTSRKQAHRDETLAKLRHKIAKLKLEAELATFLKSQQTTEAAQIVATEAKAGGLDDDDIQSIYDSADTDDDVGFVALLFLGSRKKRLRKASRQLSRKGTIRPRLMAKLAKDLAKLKAKLSMIKRWKKRARFESLINQITNLLSRAPGGSLLLPEPPPPMWRSSPQWDDDDLYGLDLDDDLDGTDLDALEAELELEERLLDAEEAHGPTPLHQTRWRGEFEDAPFGEPVEGIGRVSLGSVW